ncbi:MAG: DUF2058 family protein [Rhodanobacter sp.]
MVDSLRDQLLKCGVATPAPVARGRQMPRTSAVDKSTPAARRAPSAGAQKSAKSAAAGEIDLAKAYALRAQTQARERRQLERAAAEAARDRRERKAKLQQLLDGNVLNKADADQPRNFEYAGKIRRMYVDAQQLVALNRGELGVVQQGGRYLLVTREVAEQVRAIDAHHLALLPDPGAAPVVDDGVPDDLMW